MVCTATLALASLGVAQQSRRVLQMVSILVERNRVHTDWYSMPGSELGDAAFARIDANGDGTISETEGRAYATRALRDLTMVVDGKRRTLILRHVTIADRKQMGTGLGSIDFTFDAEVPERLGRHTLVFENRHRPATAKYETSILNDPTDKSLRIVAQRVSPDGSRLSLTYVVGKAPTFR